VWHQGPPNRPLLSAADPPRGPGRYHRKGGRATWYGSSSEAAAWAELFRHTLDPVDATEIRRRIGRVDFNVVALDLSSPELQRALGVKPAELTAHDLTVCQTLADLAAEAGFDGVLGPSSRGSRGNNRRRLRQIDGSERRGRRGPRSQDAYRSVTAQPASTSMTWPVTARESSESK